MIRPPKPTIRIERVGRVGIIARHVDGHAQLCADSYDVVHNEASARSQLHALAELATKRRRQHPRLLKVLTRFA